MFDISNMQFPVSIPKTQPVVIQHTESVTASVQITARQIAIESYQNTSYREYIFRIVQFVCTLVVFITTIVAYAAATQSEKNEHGWWKYVLILCGCTFPFLIYVAFVEGYVLRHATMRRLCIFLSICAEAAAAVFWFLGMIGLALTSLLGSGSAYDASGTAASFSFVTWLAFAVLAYAYWHGFNSPPTTQTQTVYDIEINAQSKSETVITPLPSEEDIASPAAPPPAYVAPEAKHESDR